MTCVLFNRVTVISGRWDVDNERLCAKELRLRLRRFRLERGSNSNLVMSSLDIAGSYAIQTEDDIF